MLVLTDVMISGASTISDESFVNRSSGRNTSIHCKLVITHCLAGCDFQFISTAHSKSCLAAQSHCWQAAESSWNTTASRLQTSIFCHSVNKNNDRHINHLLGKYQKHMKPIRFQKPSEIVQCHSSTIHLSSMDIHIVISCPSIWGCCKGTTLELHAVRNLAVEPLPEPPFTPPHQDCLWPTLEERKGRILVHWLLTNVTDGPMEHVSRLVPSDSQILHWIQIDLPISIWIHSKTIYSVPRSSTCFTSSIFHYNTQTFHKIRLSIYKKQAIPAKVIFTSEPRSKLLWHFPFYWFGW